MGKKVIIFALFLTVTLLHEGCTRNTSKLDYELIMLFHSTTDSTKKAKIFIRQILPAITANSPSAIANYKVCSPNPINERDFVPLIFVSLFQRLSIDSTGTERSDIKKALELLMQKNPIFSPLSDSTENHYIINSILSMCDARIKEKEWLRAFVTLLPEQSALLENIRGLLCARLQTAGEPDFGAISEIIRAAYRIERY